MKQHIKIICSVAFFLFSLKLKALDPLTFTAGGSVNYANTAVFGGTLTITQNNADVSSTVNISSLRLSTGDLIYAKIGGTTWTKIGTWLSDVNNSTIRLSSPWLGSTASGLLWCVISKVGADITIGNGTSVTFDIDMGNSDSMVIKVLAVGKSGSSAGTGAFIVNNANSIVHIRSVTTAGGANTGTITLTDGTIRLWGSYLNAAMNPAPTGLTWSLSTTAGTMEYLGSVTAQNIVNTTYFNLRLNTNTITSYGTKTALGAITVNGTLTVNAGTLDMSTFSLTNSGGTISNSGILKTSTTTNPAFSTTTTSIGGTVEFARTAGGQFIPNKTYTNLTLGNTSGTNTLIGSTVVTGVLSTTNSAGNLGLGNHWLTVARFSGPGHITGSANARISYTGSTASFLYMDSTTATTNNKLRRLTLSSNANLSLGNILSIDGHDKNKDTGEVVLNTGATLTSNIIGTASARLRLNYIDTTNRAHPFINIGHSSGSNIGKVVGEIYTEDFLQGGFDKRYRQWGHPLDSANGMSLNQFSDDVDCFGIVSSGNSGRGNLGNINGLYQNQTTPNVINNSIFKYDESNYGTSSRWVPFTNSGSTLYLERGMGYMFVLRPSGSSTGGGTSAIAPQFLEIEGQMNFADVTVSGLKISSTLKSTSTAGYNLLANPYPSHLDLTAFFNDNSDLNTTFYKYNKSSKNYETFTKGAGASWSKGPNTVSAIIDPMDAFWVQLNNAKTNPSLVANFKITQTTCSSLGGVGRSNKLEIDSTHYLNIGVKLKSQDDASVNDEATLYLGYNESDLSYKFRSGDANKLSGTCNELNIQSASGEKLATKSLDLRRDWTVPLNLKVCKLGVYDFVFDVVTNVDLSKYDIEFFDKLTGKSTPIVVGQNVKVDINNVANEFIEGRFFISFKNSQAKINAVGNSKRVILYPNPVSKNDVVHIVTLDNEKGNLQLMDSRGKVIMSKYYNGSPETVNIDLKKYSICEGIYFISFKSELNNQTVKLSIF